MDWTRAFEWMGSFAAVVTGIVWLAQRVSEKLLDAGVEQYRAKLAHENSIDLERLRSQLAIIAHRDQTLLARQGEVIAKLYELLVEAEGRCDFATGTLARSMARRDPKTAESARAATKAVSDMVSYYEQKRIYFSEPVIQVLEEIRQHLMTALGESVTAWSESVHVGLDANADDLQRERVETQRMASEIIGGRVPAARARLEAQFRELLGVVADQT
jgi:hypothetical protein